jgi:hypothetical protein
MDKFDLINEYLNGNLSDSEEKSLLFELSTNEELRSELRHFIAVNRSTKNIAQGYFVPDSSTAKIFSSIGISNDKNIKAYPAKLSILKSFPLLMPAAVTIITIALIFGIASLNGYKFVKQASDDFVYNEMKSNSNNLSAIGSNFEKNLQSKENYSQNSTSSKFDDQNFKDKTNKNVNSEISQEKKVFENQNLSNQLHSDYNSNLNIIRLDKSTLESKNPIMSELSRTDGKYHINEIEPETISMNLLNINQTEILISFEVRNSQYWNIPAATITPSAFADFHNMTMDVKYNFSNGVSIGADIRNETFFQKFDFYDTFAQYTIIEQQPNFTTFSINAAYKYLSGGTINPFSQISIGVNEVGIVSRLMIGTSYRISDNFALHLSTEFSNLSYKYRENIFNSQKIGFNYGLSYQF